MIPNAAVARTWSQTASSRFQKRLISALSPGCGPAAVESVPVTTRTPQAPARTSPASLSHVGGRRLDAAAGIAPGLDRDHHRAGEHDEREQEVRRDHQRVQVEPDRQEPERSLRDRAEEDQRRRPHHPAAEPGRLPRGDPGRRARARSERARRRGCRTRSSSARRSRGRTRLSGSRATTGRRGPSRSAGPPRR